MSNNKAQHSVDLLSHLHQVQEDLEYYYLEWKKRPSHNIDSGHSSVSKANSGGGGVRTMASQILLKRIRTASKVSSQEAISYDAIVTNSALFKSIEAELRITRHKLGEEQNFIKRYQQLHERSLSDEKFKVSQLQDENAKLKIELAKLQKMIKSHNG